MKAMIALFIFCIVLFIYLHVTFQLRTSNDLEVYEVDNISKNRLEEVCDIRQPVIIDYYNEHINKALTRNSLNENYSSFELKIRKMVDSEDEHSYLPLDMQSVYKLLKDESESKYYSENNGDFLHETGAEKHMKYNDEFIRPYMVSNCNYDLIMGANNVTTPFRYEINYRNYFYVTEGKAIIKMAPPKSSKYLSEYSDYELFEFRSPLNPWEVSPIHKADFDKVKCLEIVLEPGKIMYLPPYWWYSIKFQDNATIASFKYRTYMNNIAVSPRFCMYLLQNQNIKHTTIKKINQVSSFVGGEINTEETLEEKNE